MTDSQKIKGALPMHILLEHYKARKAAQNQYWCPIHEQTGKHKTASLVLHPNSQTVTCKSQACFEGANVFGVIAKIEGLDVKKDYPNILKIAAQIAGVSMDSDSGNVPGARLRYRPLTKAHGTYLLKRGLTRDTIKLMDLGALYDKVAFLYREGKVVVGYKAKTILPRKQWDEYKSKNPKWISYFIKGDKPSWWSVGSIGDKKILYLVAGEYDAAILHQELKKKGLDSEMGVITFITGEGSGVPPKEVKRLGAIHKGEWRIVYDDDEAGHKGMPARADELSELGKKVSTFMWTKKLNPTEKGGYDINDHFLETSNIDIFLDANNFQEYTGGGGVHSFVEKRLSDNGPVYVYKVGEHMWEFANGSLTVKDVANKILYQKRCGNASLMTAATQSAIAKDLEDLGVYDDKKDVKKSTLFVVSHLVNERHQEKENAKEVLQLLDRDIALEEIHQAIAKIGVTTKEMVEIQMATLISGALNLGIPIWLLVIGTPSSMKTEVLKLFRGISVAYYLSTMSENAFASGYMPTDGSEPNDLLSRLDGRALLIRDLTTLFSLKEDTVKKILGDLTSIFDGVFEKFTATRGQVSYKAVFSLIACITPAILNKHHNYVNQLGPRFLAYRIPHLSETDSKKGYGIAWSNENRAENIMSATLLASSYCEQIIERSKKAPLPTITDHEVIEWFNDAAEFIRRVRGIAITQGAKFTNEEGKEVTYYEAIDVQIEEPWRALNQLRNLAISLAVLRKKESVTMEECKTLETVARSAAQIDRVEVLNALVDTAGATRTEISKGIGKSTKTIGRRLKELHMLGLVHSFKSPDMQDNSKAPALWALEPRFSRLLNKSEKSALPPESVSSEDEDTNYEGGNEVF